MVEQKLKSVADELGKGTPDAVAREVISSPRSSTAQALVEALITPETGFSDNRSFMALKEAVLPSLIEKRALQLELLIFGQLDVHRVRSLTAF